MKFHVSARLEYAITPPLTLIFCIRARYGGMQAPVSENLEIVGSTVSELINMQPENQVFDRVRLTEGDNLVVNYTAEVETHLRHFKPDDLRKAPPSQLAPGILPYLFPSRYCQSDLLGRFAWQKFGQYSDPYDQVLAVTDWIHSNIEYLRGETNSSTSAFDTVTQCAGVCRDFSHLGIALCRALNIPARYLSAYACNLQPPDFHACFEVYIGGHWIVFDPTRLAPVNGLVRIGSGRDAADVAVCTTFGKIQSLGQLVECRAAEASFHPLSLEELQTTAVSMDPFPKET